MTTWSSRSPPGSSRPASRRSCDAAARPNGTARSRTVPSGSTPYRGPRPRTAIELAAREFDLVHLLMANPGEVLRRERIMDEVWDPHWFGPTKTLDVHISWLRKKIEDDPSNPEYITTIRGIRFRFRNAEPARGRDRRALGGDHGGPNAPRPGLRPRPRGPADRARNPADGKPSTSRRHRPRRPPATTGTTTTPPTPRPTTPRRTETTTSEAPGHRPAPGPTWTTTAGPVRADPTTGRASRRVRVPVWVQDRTRARTRPGRGRATSRALDPARDQEMTRTPTGTRTTESSNP